MLFSQISVFGFGADSDGNWNHYFEMLKKKWHKTGHHPGVHEYILIQYLDKIQMVTFYKGW